MRRFLHHAMTKPWDIKPFSCLGNRYFTKKHRNKALILFPCVVLLKNRFSPKKHFSAHKMLHVRCNCVFYPAFVQPSMPR